MKQSKKLVSAFIFAVSLLASACGGAEPGSEQSAWESNRIQVEEVMAQEGEDVAPEIGISASGVGTACRGGMCCDWSGIGWCCIVTGGGPEFGTDC